MMDSETKEAAINMRVVSPSIHQNYNPTLSHQIDILESNFEFYHAWVTSLFQESECSNDVRVNIDKTSMAMANSVLVSRLHEKCNKSSVSDFFSVFGTVKNVEITRNNQTSDLICLVIFEEGSGGAQKTIDSQPIEMFGNVLGIQLATETEVSSVFEERNSNDSTRNTVEHEAPARYPLIVARPEYGPWYHKPPEVSYLKPSTLASPSKAAKTEGQLGAIIAPNCIPPSIDFPLVKQKGMQHEKSLQQRTSSSIHSLLSPVIGDSLFDDDSDDVVINDQFRNRMGHTFAQNVQSGNNTPSIECFHCDDVLVSWVWATAKSNNSKDQNFLSNAERELYSTLKLGRASNASSSLLSVISSPSKNKYQHNSMEGTNLHMLHKSNAVSVTNHSTLQTESYILYQARHPCLAPLISVTKCSTNFAQVSKMESFVSIFDITPSCHQPLDELLRTGGYLTKPLFPRIKGGGIDQLCTQNNDNTQHREAFNSALSSFLDDYGDQDICKCHTISNRAREADTTLSYQEINTRSELRQFRSSTSTIFSMCSEQEISDEVQKCHLLPQAPSHHPQIYSRFNQTRMMYKVGTTYHADIADLRIRFLAFQLFHAVNFCHSKGLTLGEQLDPNRIYIQNDGCVRLVVPITHQTCSDKIQYEDNDYREVSNMPNAPSTEEIDCKRRYIFDRYEGDEFETKNISVKHSGGFPNQESVTVVPYPGYGLLPYVQWQRGLLSNFQYLMMINAAAGRTVGDQVNPPILPWVTDFTSEINLKNVSNSEEAVLSTPWRDLTKTKYRLHKGDEQLDQSFKHGSPPHHIPETISDLTYTVYRARCLPLAQLKSKVRNQFIPEHYPSSMKTLYRWTPDEATHEFYSHSCPCIFTSKHTKMKDLLLPDWCNNDVCSFISYHRRLLDSNQVGEHLHSWIDLTFGVALSGERSILEKNVVLHHVKWNAVQTQYDNRVQCRGECHSAFSEERPTVDSSETHNSKRSTFVQLFCRPHPKRAFRLDQTMPYLSQLCFELDGASKLNNEFQRRKQHDLSKIGAILQECYASTRVVPDDEVRDAINSLLNGKIDIHLSLQIHKKDAEGLFPFPACVREAYHHISSRRNITFKRDRCDESVLHCSDITIRSTGLERAWATVRHTNIYSSLSSTSAGLLLHTLIFPLSYEWFIENYETSRPFGSYLDKLGCYILELSKLIPVELLLPELFRFFSASLDGEQNNLAVTEALGKLLLNETLISTLYSKCTWELCIKNLSCFITKQLCRKTSGSNLQSKRLDMDSMVGLFISFLSQSIAIGSTVCCRYIVPLLIDQIEGFSVSENSNVAIKALRNFIPFFYDDVVGISIVKPIMKLIWQKILHRRYTIDDLPIFQIHLLCDLLSLLRSCLLQMESNTERYFFETTPLSITELLLFSFKAVVSGNQKSMIEEKRYYEEVHNELCHLVKSLLAKVDVKKSTEIVLPTIETLASEVNNEYLRIRLKTSSKYEVASFVDPNLTCLPGVADTFMVAKELVRVIDDKLLLQHQCSSVLELLSWADPTNVKRTQPVDNVDPNCTKKKETISVADPDDASTTLPITTNVYVNRKAEFTKQSIDNTSMLFEEAIEMLVPRHNTVHETDSDDDTNDSLPSNGNSTIKSEYSYSAQRIDIDRPMSEMEHCRLPKQKQDLVWSIGVHRLPNRDQCPFIRYFWKPRIMVTTYLTFDSCNEARRRHKYAVTSMATNKSEGLLVAGNSLGEVVLFDLRCHPPSLRLRYKFARAIVQVGFLNTNDVLVCNGGLHLWDIHTGALKSSLTSENTFQYDDRTGFRPSKCIEFVGYSASSDLSCSSELLQSGSVEVAAISSNHLYLIDLRCGVIKSWPEYRHHADPMIKRLLWCTKSNISDAQLPTQKGYSLDSQSCSFNMKCISSAHDWVCVGSASGHIHCFNRRHPKLLVCWKAHPKQIQYLRAISRQQVLSVGADKTAVVWDLSKSPPLQVCSINNLPGKVGTMNISSYHFEENGIVSIPGEGNLLLCAATGRKAVFQSMSTTFQQNKLSIDTKANRIVMSDYKGSHIASAGKLSIHSIVLLPLRQLLLLGCEDKIQVCL